MLIFDRVNMLNNLRLLLWPFSLLYRLVIALRNQAYDRGIFKSHSFDVPLIVIGNLAIGGTGKSPMAEFIVRLFREESKVAILSRGYGRKTKGFIIVTKNDNPLKVGDEPLQFKRKFPKVTVAVCEDRVEGVSKLKTDHDIIILDDAYQHRALRPGLSILLIEYKSLFQPKILLPAGDFRDSFNQKNRADIIVVTKSPRNLSTSDMHKAEKRLAIKQTQRLFFSHLKYGQPFPFNSALWNDDLKIDGDTVVLALSGIADPALFVKYLESYVKRVELMRFPDHHQFTRKDIGNVIARLRTLKEEKKMIVTTEKDAQRLMVNFLSDMVQDLPILVLPIKTAFKNEDNQSFQKLLLKYYNSKKKINNNA